MNIYYESAYLQHYGVPGMKWGVRRNRKKANEHRSKVETSRTNIGKRYHTLAAYDHQFRAERGQRIINAKSVRSHIREAYGHKNEAERAKIASKANAEMGRYSKSRFGKAAYKQAAYNLKQESEYQSKMANSKNVKEYADTWIKDVGSRKYMRLSGRVTTSGKQAVDVMLTGGWAGLAMDALYLRNKNKQHRN